MPMYLPIRQAWIARIIGKISSIVLALSASAVHCVAANPPTLVVQWNNAALQGDRDSSFGPPMIARALAIVHTCMYDAWAPYDAKAVGTRLGGTLRRPASERTVANKQEAISFGAFRVLVYLFPFDIALFNAQMTSLGYDPSDQTTDVTTPSGIGNVACAAVLSFRHHKEVRRAAAENRPRYTAAAAQKTGTSERTVCRPPITVIIEPNPTRDIMRGRETAGADGITGRYFRDRPDHDPGPSFTRSRASCETRIPIPC